MHVRSRVSKIKRRRKRQGYFAKRRTLNAECRAANDSEVLWLGLGNQVNEVSGQFSWYNDSKWNLIYSVTLITKTSIGVIWRSAFCSYRCAFCKILLPRQKWTKKKTLELKARSCLKPASGFHAQLKWLIIYSEVWLKNWAKQSARAMSLFQNNV